MKCAPDTEFKRHPVTCPPSFEIKWHRMTWRACSVGRYLAGDVVATVGFGAGLTWASAILRW